MRANLRPLGGLVACGLLIAIGLGMAACAATLAVSDAKVEPGVFYCFEGKVRGKRGTRAIGCFDTERFCRDSLATARQYGGLAGAYDLTNCERFALQ